MTNEMELMAMGVIPYNKETKGITEDGFDLHEEQVRQEFEEYAIRKGYVISRHYNNPWEYYDSELENLWRVYHLGHVRGRGFNEN